MYCGSTTQRNSCILLSEVCTCIGDFSILLCSTKFAKPKSHKTSNIYKQVNLVLKMVFYASTWLIPQRTFLFSFLLGCYHSDLCLTGISLQVVCGRQVDHFKCHMNHSSSFDHNVFRHTIKKCHIWKPFIWHLSEQP